VASNTTPTPVLNAMSAPREEMPNARSSTPVLSASRGIGHDHSPYDNSPTAPTVQMSAAQKVVSRTGNATTMWVRSRHDCGSRTALSHPANPAPSASR